ncbi:inverse autotransporter beta domain-containing protein [Bathymodiolus septemdierum thioautotrophic gill symbiont]|uniref:Adhesin/invasin n=1 Tax=endosymbiont of Bathymodiolus septemdierum str. Myojin knoll TaxID=1303921 RepID=A0A0P0UQ30_9GAMM|nr:inverse autotransporter beta domain-containing protein [Bathymodiolus septemdierum thioautotrophic gill symbiont]BAS67065.1 adhesin/invasin [endosymbiont of Bathymodiolus septemdierum str. Myojin knoll]
MKNTKTLMLTNLFKSIFNVFKVSKNTQTHSSIANIAGGHISNVLNKLKQLLLFSALTLSLNVTAVDKPQSFDKEAYLNLNQEYNWNNPQTYYKKDNQGLLILKQVGSTVRNTLGATNSDNANQFGSTLKDNLKNQAINQAVSGTEGYINNKANEYANQFGAGRTEIQLGGFNSEALNYNIRTIQPLSELNEDSQDLIFFQGQLTSGQNHSERRETLNLGIGYRKLLEAGQSIAGINLFTDYETQSAHKRASIGLEYQRTNFKANFNKYQSLSDKKVIGSFTEEVLDGYDVKLEGQIPYLPWAKIKGTRYVWDKTTNANSVDIKGTILGVEVQLSDAARFEFGTEKSNSADSNSYARLSMAIPFKDSKFTNFKIADKAFKNTNKMQLGEFAWVERSNKIRIEKVTNGGTIILGEYNAFTVGATCTITDSASVSTVATTEADGSVTLPSLSIPAGLVTMSCTGGTYTDEATNAAGTVAATLRVATIYSGTGPLTILASPLSEIAYQLADAAGGIATDITAQNIAVATAFGIAGVDLAATIPTDISPTTGTVAGNDPAGKFAIALAAVSQIMENSATDGGQSPSAAKATTLITALVTDMGDGDIDGIDDGTGTMIDIAMAISNFDNGTGNNNPAADTGSSNTGTAATATGEGSIKGNLAILKISNYDGTNAVPTVQDYVDAGVTGVTAANLVEVNKKADTATTTDSDSTVEIQALVDSVAAAAASDSVLADIGTDVNTASTSDTTIAEFGSILPALTDFVNANLSAYQTYIDANPGSFTSPATQAEVQAMITAVNAAVTAAASDSVLADIGTDANTASTSDTTIAEFGSILPALTDFVNANLSAYQTYIDANPGSFASPATQAEVQAMITAVNAAVTAAASDSVLADIGTDANTASTSDTTIAEFGSILPALTDFVNANLSAYQTYIDANPGSFASPATQAEVQAMITAVNAAVTAAAASDSVLADIGTDANTASTSDTTIAEFGSILPALTDFVNANLSAYQTYIDANPGSFASPATQAEVQAMITAVNAAVILATVSVSNSTVTATPSSVVADGSTTSTITLQVKDASNNNLTIGGLTVTMSASGSAAVSSVTDNTDGTYTAIITNSTVETVTITAAFGGSNVTNTADVTFTFVSETITFGGGSYKTVLSPDTGKVWLDRNLGATAVCSASGGATNPCYGDLYQWGRRADGHEDRTNISTSGTLTSDVTNAGTTLFITSASDWASVDSIGTSRTAAWADGGSNDICPAGFSVPTEAELTADTISATTTDITNSATAFSSFLKIPVAGSRFRSNGTLDSVGTIAILWSRSAGGSNARALAIGSGSAAFFSGSRALGFSVRCIKD